MLQLVSPPEMSTTRFDGQVELEDLETGERRVIDSAEVAATYRAAFTRVSRALPARSAARRRRLRADLHRPRAGVRAARLPPASRDGVTALPSASMRRSASGIRPSSHATRGAASDLAESVGVAGFAVSRVAGADSPARPRADRAACSRRCAFSRRRACCRRDGDAFAIRCCLPFDWGFWPRR